jgi:hypothetical protein
MVTFTLDRPEIEAQFTTPAEVTLARLALLELKLSCTPAGIVPDTANVTRPDPHCSTPAEAVKDGVGGKDSTEIERVAVDVPHPVVTE